MKNRVYMSLFLSAVFLISGCGRNSYTPHSTQSGVAGTPDTSESYSQYGTITLRDDGTTYSGSGISVNGNTVTISEGGGYILTGILSNGQIVVDTKKDVILVMSGADITSARSSAIAFTKSGKAIIETAHDTENRLSDGTEKVKKKDTDGDTNAVLYSKSEVELYGSGILYITGNQRDGIHSDKKVDIYSGTLNISSKDKAVSASKKIVVHGGDIVITNSKEGIESKGELIIDDGHLTISANDDALNAGENLVINGGYIEAICNGDGFDSNGNMTINGGEIYIFAGNGDNSALDISDGDKIGKFAINGGTVVAAGGDMPIEVQKKSKQDYAWIYPQDSLVGEVEVVSDSGETIINFAFPKECDLLFVSSDRIKSGGNYVVRHSG